jgi:hypothetical protein
MICWHKTLQTKGKKNKKWSSLWAIPQWLQIEMDKTFETIKVDCNF